MTPLARLPRGIAENPTQAPKTIQLVPLPGFQTPKWLLDRIPSCDALFQSPVQRLLKRHAGR